MGTIRDEIEKLKIPIGPMVWRRADKEYNEVIADVLSILDEWKLVGEYPWTDNKSEQIESLIGKRLAPGDHIAIYRRRKGQ